MSLKDTTQRYNGNHIFCFQYHNTLILLGEKGWVGFFFLTCPIVTLMDFCERTEKFQSQDWEEQTKTGNTATERNVCRYFFSFLACIDHEASLKSLILMYPSDSTGH